MTKTHRFKFYGRDIIALVALLGIGFLIYSGFNGWLQGIGALIIGYYFTHRDTINK